MGGRKNGLVAELEQTYSPNRANGKVYPKFILGIFSDSLDRLDVPWRRMNRMTISVARGPVVLKLDGFIGPKS